MLILNDDPLLESGAHWCPMNGKIIIDGSSSDLITLEFCSTLTQTDHRFVESIGERKILENSKKLVVIEGARISLNVLVHSVFAGPVGVALHSGEKGREKKDNLDE